MKVDTVISQAIYEHCENTKGFPNQDYIVALEKLKRTLEIIKKKKVFVKWLRADLSSYNSTCALYDLPRLTKEEYYLLKEVLL